MILGKSLRTSLRMRELYNKYSDIIEEKTYKKI